MADPSFVEKLREAADVAAAMATKTDAAEVATAAEETEAAPGEATAEAAESEILQAEAAVSVAQSPRQKPSSLVQRLRDAADVEAAKIEKAQAEAVAGASAPEAKRQKLSKAPMPTPIAQPKPQQERGDCSTGAWPEQLDDSDLDSD